MSEQRLEVGDKVRVIAAYCKARGCVGIITYIGSKKDPMPYVVWIDDAKMTREWPFAENELEYLSHVGWPKYSKKPGGST